LYKTLAQWSRWSKAGVKVASLVIVDIPGDFVVMMVLLIMKLLLPSELKEIYRP
jgi:hypothetical protein